MLMHVLPVRNKLVRLRVLHEVCWNCGTCPCCTCQFVILLTMSASTATEVDPNISLPTCGMAGSQPVGRLGRGSAPLWKVLPTSCASLVQGRPSLQANRSASLRPCRPLSCRVYALRNYSQFDKVVTLLALHTAWQIGYAADCRTHYHEMHVGRDTCRCPTSECSTTVLW